MDKKAKDILFQTYWSNTGWKENLKRMKWRIILIIIAIVWLISSISNLLNNSKNKNN